MQIKDIKKQVVIDNDPNTIYALKGIKIIHNPNKYKIVYLDADNMDLLD